jgi:hypothetical protein
MLTPRVHPYYQHQRTFDLLLPNNERKNSSWWTSESWISQASNTLTFHNAPYTKWLLISTLDDHPHEFPMDTNDWTMHLQYGGLRFVPPSPPSSHSPPPAFSPLVHLSKLSFAKLLNKSLGWLHSTLSLNAFLCLAQDATTQFKDWWYGAYSLSLVHLKYFVVSHSS